MRAISVMMIEGVRQCFPLAKIFLLCSGPAFFAFAKNAFQALIVARSFCLKLIDVGLCVNPPLEALRPVLTELASMSARAAAAELNRRKVATPSGGRWHAATVLRVRDRLQRM
jgi:hypothetical protein